MRRRAALVAVRERARGRVAYARSWSESRSASRDAAPRAGRADAERRDLHVLAHRETAERATVLERPRQPARPRRCGRQRVTSRPSSSTEPFVRKVEPGQDVHERRLAAPFGPIRPTTSCRWSSSVTSRSACTPSNARETAAARSDAPDRRAGQVVVRQAALDLRDDLRLDRGDEVGVLSCTRITRYARP